MIEDEVFTAMRKLAVREENAMIARVALHNMRQDQDEPIRAYGARLRGQANVCKFTQQCTGCEANVDVKDPSSNLILNYQQSAIDLNQMNYKILRIHYICTKQALLTE